jgi:CHASE3 domain sensor protein
VEPRSFASARLRPRSITSTLLASLLLLATVGLAALGVVYWNHRTVRSSMRELTHVAEPLDAAAHEMEINTIGSGLAVAQYLRTGDRAQLVRLEDDTGDFRRASGRLPAAGRHG